MIIDNDPPITRHISVPKDLSSLSCSSFTAGVVEAVLDGLGFVRRDSPNLSCHLSYSPQPARVTAHNTPAPGQPQRTTILIKLEKSVMEREDLMK
jgi:trafficking protein particle complex subunit 5